MRVDVSALKALIRLIRVIALSIRFHLGRNIVLATGLKKYKNAEIGLESFLVLLSITQAALGRNTRNLGNGIYPISVVSSFQMR